MNLIFDFFPQQVVSSLGWTLLHSLWQGAIISLILYFTLYYLKNRAAEIKAFLSASALVILLLAAVITFVIEYNAPAKILVNAPSLETTTAGNLFVNPVDFNNTNNNTTLFSKIYNDFQLYFKNNLQLIVTLWLAGFLFFAIRFAGGAYYTARMRKNVFMLDDKYLIERFNNLIDRAGLGRIVLFAESHLVKVPIVLGYIKPMILLPIGLISGLPQDQIEAIIAHEIAHIKRYDILINLFQSIAEIIFFFNPAVWYISHKIRIERENACDDIAINLCGNSVVYAKALANVESFKESNEPLFAIPLFKNQNQLLRRIKRMLHKDQNQNGFKEKFAAVLIFIGILVFAAVIKNVSPAVSGSEAQYNKAGITLPSSIFVGGKELSGIEIDTTKAVHGKRSFSYFQKEDGKMKRYRAKMKDGQLSDLSIDGEKVAQDKLNNYKKDVEEAYSKLDNEDFFFSHNLFPDSLRQLTSDIARSFNTKEFREQMKSLQKEIQAGVKEHFNSQEFKKDMDNLQKEIQAQTGKLKSHFNSDEFKSSKEQLKKEIEHITQNLKSENFKHNGEFDEKEFEKAMDEVGKTIEKTVQKMVSEEHLSLEKLGAFKGLEHLKSLEHLKGLEALKHKDFAMKGFEKGMKEFNVKMKDFGGKMKVFGEKMKVFGKFMKEVKDMLVDEKLIDKDDNDMNLNIKKDGVYIDGKKQSDAVFQKVKDIYKKYYTKEFDGDFDLNINDK